MHTVALVARGDHSRRQPIPGRLRPMKRMFVSALLFAAISAGQVTAQDPAKPALPPLSVSGPSSEPLSPTAQGVAPEVWVYMQERQRYEDPKQAVRRKAEARASARQARLESRRWYGLSNSRPVAAVTPFMDHYSPAWRGNGFHAFDYWMGRGPSVAIYLDADTLRR